MDDSASEWLRLRSATAVFTSHCYKGHTTSEEAIRPAETSWLPLINLTGTVYSKTDRVQLSYPRDIIQLFQAASATLASGAEWQFGRCPEVEQAKTAKIELW
jgi:hypothetical protein